MYDVSHIDPYLSPCPEPVDPLDLRAMVDFLTKLEGTTPKNEWILALRAGVEQEIRSNAQDNGPLL